MLIEKIQNIILCIKKIKGISLYSYTVSIQKQILNKQNHITLYFDSVNQIPIGLV